jgi:hypothetical protein
MHSGVLMLLRQAFAQYMITAKRWQRVLIAAGLSAAGPILFAVGSLTGHFLLAVAGIALVAGTGRVAQQALRARRAGPAQDGTEDEAQARA